jgi:hypothetical protein
MRTGLLGQACCAAAGIAAKAAMANAVMAQMPFSPARRFLFMSLSPVVYK